MVRGSSGTERENLMRLSFLRVGEGQNPGKPKANGGGETPK